MKWIKASERLPETNEPHQYFVCKIKRLGDGTMVDTLAYLTKAWIATAGKDQQCEWLEESPSPSVAEAAREYARVEANKSAPVLRTIKDQLFSEFDEGISMWDVMEIAYNNAFLAGAAYASAGVPDWVGELTSRVTELVYYSQISPVEGVRPAGMLSHDESWREAQKLLWKYCTAAADDVHYLPKNAAGEGKMREALENAENRINELDALVERAWTVAWNKGSYADEKNYDPDVEWEKFNNKHSGK